MRMESLLMIKSMSTFQKINYSKSIKQWSRMRRLIWFLTWLKDRTEFHFTWLRMVKRHLLLDLLQHWTTTTCCFLNTEKLVYSYGEVLPLLTWQINWQVIILILERGDKCLCIMDQRNSILSQSPHLWLHKFLSVQEQGINIESTMRIELQ